MEKIYTINANYGLVVDAENEEEVREEFRKVFDPTFLKLTIKLLDEKPGRFKKGDTTKEAYKVLLHDLECLELKKTKSNEYHYNLLKGNLKDIFN